MNSLCPVVVHALFISYILVIQTKGYSQSYETGGVCYWFSDRTETLQAANQTCAEMTGHLAQLHSREIFDSVIRNMKGHGNAYWVGLHKVISDYYWDNKDSPTSSQWNPSEPNDTGDCVRLTYTTSGHRLADNPCTLLYNFICEKPFEPASTPIQLLGIVHALLQQLVVLDSNQVCDKGCYSLNHGRRVNGSALRMHIRGVCFQQ
ncbi:perlucin-like [Haliotis rufescens]|uniref:perlucin-like n=1 Tax=Haliotis rufescens TaxID=6454 RepID=UPI00201F1802|nr:perlucin-like [Haliotis rufescens]